MGKKRTKPTNLRCAREEVILMENHRHGLNSNGSVLKQNYSSPRINITIRRQLRLLQPYPEVSKSQLLRVPGGAQTYRDSSLPQYPASFPVSIYEGPMKSDAQTLGM